MVLVINLIFKSLKTIKMEALINFFTIFYSLVIIFMVYKLMYKNTPSREQLNNCQKLLETKSKEDVISLGLNIRADAIKVLMFDLKNTAPGKEEVYDYNLILNKINENEVSRSNLKKRLYEVNKVRGDRKRKKIFTLLFSPIPLFIFMIVLSLIGTLTLSNISFIFSSGIILLLSSVCLN